MQKSRWISAAPIVLFLAACHGGTNGLAPLLKSSSVGALGQSVQSTIVVDSIERPADRSPDGAFSLRQPHDARIRLHLAIFTKRSNGFVSQREYVSPYGTIVISQRARNGSTHNGASNNTPQSLNGAARDDAQTPIADGVTSHGAHWYLLAIENNRWELHVQFPDVVVDTLVPEGTPTAVIRQLVEEVY